MSGAQSSAVELNVLSRGQAFEQRQFEDHPELSQLFTRYLSSASWELGEQGVLVTVPTKFHAKGVQRFLNEIEQRLGHNIRSVEILQQGPRIQVPVQPSLPLAPVRPKAAVRSEAPLFVSSPSMETSYALCERWASQCFRSSSPQVLWVHGASGCGKTHLIKQLNRWIEEERTIEHTDVMSFLHNWRKAIESKTHLAFAKKYRRDTDVFILENVEQLRNKKGTQDEVLFTIQALMERGCAVVVSSAEHPLKLQECLEPALYSRLMGGLSIEIPPIDRLFKERFWRHMLKFYQLEHVTLDVRVSERLMNIPTQTARQTSSLFVKALGILSFKNVLSLEELVDLEKLYSPQREIQSARDPQKLIDEVARLCGISTAAIRGTSRRSDISIARRFVFHALSRHYGLTNAMIAHYTEKDPSSVCHGLRLLETELATKRHVYEQWNWLCQQLGLSHLQKYHPSELQ